MLESKFFSLNTFEHVLEIPTLKIILFAITLTILTIQIRTVHYLDSYSINSIYRIFGSN